MCVCVCVCVCVCGGGGGGSPQAHGVAHPLSIKTDRESESGSSATCALKKGYRRHTRIGRFPFPGTAGWGAGCDVGCVSTRFVHPAPAVTASFMRS